MTTQYATMPLSRADREVVVLIQGDWLEPRPATRLDPPEGGMFEDVIALLDGEEIELTPRELDDATQILIDSGSRFEPVIVRRPLLDREKMLEFITKIAELADNKFDESEPVELKLARCDLVNIAKRLGDILGSEQRKAG